MYLSLLKLFNSALFRLNTLNNFIELLPFFTISKLIVSNYLVFIIIIVIFFIFYLFYFLKINSLFKLKLSFYITNKVTICILKLVLFFPIMLIIVKYTNGVSVFLYLLNLDLFFTIGLIFFNRTVNWLTSASISIYTLKRTFFFNKDIVLPHLSITQKEQLDSLHLSLTHNPHMHNMTYHYIENIQCFETSNEYITIPSKKVQIVTFLYQKDYYVAFSSQLL